MNRFVERGLGIILLLASQAAIASAAGITWSKGWTVAQAEARRTNKPMMVDFYTDWCGWCKKLDADVYPNAKVVLASTQFVPLRTNAEKEGKDMAAKYGVHAFPTILFIDGKGALVGKIVGYEPAADFAVSLNQIVKDAKSFPVLEAHVKANPADTTAGLKLLSILIQRQQLNDAASLAKSLEGQGPAVSAKLLDAYGEIGDAYNDQEKSAEAITWYKKILELSKDPAAIAKAHVQIAVADINQKKWDDAEAEAKTLSESPGASAQDKDVAQRIIAYAQNQKAGGDTAKQKTDGDTEKQKTGGDTAKATDK